MIQLENYAIKKVLFQKGGYWPTRQINVLTDHVITSPLSPLGEMGNYGEKQPWEIVIS